MARMRRTANNEAADAVATPKADIVVKDAVAAARRGDGLTSRPPVGDPEIVVHEPAPKAAPEQRWTLRSYPFYEPPRREPEET